MTSSERFAAMRRRLGREWYEPQLHRAPDGGFWCPFHADEGTKRSGLSLRDCDDGAVRWHCHSCKIDGDAVGFHQRLQRISSATAALEDLERQFGASGATSAGHQSLKRASPKPPKPPTRYRFGDRARGVPASATERVYDYEFADGSHAYCKLRWDWTTETGERKKACAFINRDEGASDVWWWGRGGPAVLYGLPIIQEHELVLYAEGEQCVEVARSLRFPATTAGSSADWRDEFAGDLVAAGVKTIVILPDNDDQGWKCSAAVAASCQARGIRVYIVELPGLGEGEDIADWVERGGSREALLELIDAATPWAPEPSTSADGGEPAPSRMEKALLYLADRTEPNARDGVGFSRDHAKELMPVAERVRERGTGALSEEEARRVSELLRTYKRQLAEGGFRLSELRPTTECPSLVPRTAVEVLSAELEPPEILWGTDAEPLLVCGELSLLHAREGVGKSWFILGVAAAIACGLSDFLGIRIRQARALVISPELSKWYEQWRLRLVIGDREPPEDLLLLGRDAAGLDLAQPDHLKRLEEVIADCEPQLLVLDPLAALWLCEELNLDFQTLTRRLAEIAERYGVAILLAHHEGKASSSSKDDDASAFRGGTALRAGVRTAIRLAEEPIRGGVRVAFTKSNLGRVPGDLFLVKGEPWRFELGEAPPSSKETAQKNDEKLRTFLLNHPNSTAEAISDAVGIAPSTIGRIYQNKKRAKWMKRTKAEGEKEFLYYLDEEAE